MKNTKFKIIVTALTVILTFSVRSQTLDWAYTHTQAGWTFNVPAALTTDQNGNVYVTGRKYDTGSNDYFTHKLDPMGNLLWIATHNGIMNTDDRSLAIAVDLSGNVFVTGYSYDTVNNQKDIKTIKYSQAGNLVWMKTYNGPGSFDDEAKKILIDNNGNVIIAGTSYGTGSVTDYVVLKYSQEGNLIWITRYNGTANSYDEVSDMKLHTSGDVIVTGSSTGTGTGYDFATLRLSISNGSVIWESRYNNPETGGNPDKAIALAVTPSGNVAVTGVSNSTNGGWDFLTQCYSGATGGQLWTKRYNGSMNSWDEPTGITADDNGNVFVSGMSYETGNFNSQSTIIKYSSTGNAEWIRHYYDNLSIPEYPKAITIDPEGNPYITISANGEPIIINLKLSNQTGNILWQHNYIAGGYTEPADIHVDNNGSIYVTAQTGSRTTTIKYSQSLTSIQNNNNSANEFLLEQNYPNPFNPTTTVRFTIEKQSEVKLAVFDITGKSVVVLVNGIKPAGSHEIIFDASKLSSGTYFYRLESGNFSEVKKMVLIK